MRPAPGCQGQDVQELRINVQSIITRHFLLTHLFPCRFTALMEQEPRFALVINWLLKLFRASI